MGKVSVVWAALNESGERAWILDQEIERESEPEEGAWILEKQLSQKKYTRHEGLVEWLLSLKTEEGPISPPFDVFISTFVNKNGVTSVQRIEVSSQNSVELPDTQPIRRYSALPQLDQREQGSRRRAGGLWLGIGIFPLVVISALMQFPT